MRIQNKKMLLQYLETGNMDGPRWHLEEQWDEIVFDQKNRQDRISILLFADYTNAILPFLPDYLLPSLEKMSSDEIEWYHMVSFLEFYWPEWRNSWALGKDSPLLASEVQNHPYAELIWELNRGVEKVNWYLKSGDINWAVKEANSIFQLLKTSTPEYTVKRSF